MQNKEVAYFEIKPTQVIVLGRGEKCNITLVDDFSSTQHCSIRFEDGYLIIKDLDSKNGTFVNENLIYESYIYIGDNIRMGNTHISLAKEKMSAQEVEYFTYKGKKIDTEFMSISQVKHDDTKGSIVKIELDKNVKGHSAHFAELRRQRKKPKEKPEEKTEEKEERKGILSKIFKKND